MTSYQLGFLSLLAFAPVLTVGVLLVGVRMSARRAMPIAYATTLAIAWAVWKVPLEVVVAASLQGLV